MSVNASEMRGLQSGVRNALRVCVLEAVNTWKSVPQLDLWKVRRDSRISLEPRRGVKSSIAMFKLLGGLESFLRLKELVRTAQPELGAWVGTSAGGTALDLENVVTNLVVQLDSVPTENTQTEIDRLLDEIDVILQTRSIRMIVLAPLRNVMLPSLAKPLEVGYDVRLRRIDPDELNAFETHDVLFGAPIPRLGLLNVALETNFTSRVELGNPDSASVSSDYDQYKDAFERIDRAHCALHSFSEGCASIAFQLVRSESSALPGLGGVRVQPASASHLGAFSLDESQLALLEKFCMDMALANRRELSLAVARLRDAEMRNAPLDSMVDAFVGLEALLNPKVDGELSFRIALNFATLGERKSRFDRFRSMRDLYAVRSKIVHGATTGESFRVGESTVALDEAARTSRQHLRFVIHEFLKDTFLRSSEKITFSYWEKRYFQESA